MDYTHGILVLNPSLEDDEGTPIVGFVGMYTEPTIQDLWNVKGRINDDDFDYLIADEDQIVEIRSYIQDNPDTIFLM